MAAATRASVARSRFEVASSSSRIAGSTSSARARAISWRWPADSERPRSETSVVVTAGQLGDEVVGPDGPRGGLDLVVAGVGTAVGDVVADRAREQERLLGHVAELAAVGVTGRRSAGRCRRRARLPSSGRRNGPAASRPSTCLLRSRPRAPRSRPGAISRSMPRSASGGGRAASALGAASGRPAAP